MAPSPSLSIMVYFPSLCIIESSSLSAIQTVGSLFSKFLSCGRESRGSMPALTWSRPPRPRRPQISRWHLPRRSGIKIWLRTSGRKHLVEAFLPAVPGRAGRLSVQAKAMASWNRSRAGSKTSPQSGKTGRRVQTNIRGVQEPLPQGYNALSPVGQPVSCEKRRDYNTIQSLGVQLQALYSPRRSTESLLNCGFRISDCRLRIVLMEKPFINFESEIAIANPQSRPSVCPRGKQDVLLRQGQSLNRRAAPAILLFAPSNSGNVRGIRGFRGVRASPEGAVAASVRRPYPPALSGAGEGSLLHRDRSGSALWLVRPRPGSLVFISLFPRLAPRDRRVF